MGSQAVAIVMKESKAVLINFTFSIGGVSSEMRDSVVRDYTTSAAIVIRTHRVLARAANDPL